MDLDLLTDFGGEIATAIGVAGGLFITAVVATQTFPFIASWVRKVRAAGSGR
jgi:hypothetical protein